MIKRIGLQNIKGFGSADLSVDLLPNKPTLLVAPNGFGKSSLAAGFKYLNRNRLNLPQEFLHKGDESNLPRLSLSVDFGSGLIELAANHNSNTITHEFDWFVINSLVRPKGIIRKFSGKTAVSASAIVDSITLIDTVPDRERFSYNFSKVRQCYGKLAKAIPNISSLDAQIFSRMEECGILEALQKMHQTRTAQRIEEFKERMETAISTQSKEQILALIESQELPNLRQISHLSKAAKYFEKLETDNSEYGEVCSFLVTIQLSDLFKENIDQLRKVCRRKHYELEKEALSDTFKSFNSAWIEFRPREKNGSLILEFPDLNLISNGQRDIMCFVAQLHKARQVFRKKRSILIIDEIFDYLDEANLVAAQYFITKFIEQFKHEEKEIYPVILTHIAPELFHGYVFGRRHKLHKKYLKEFSLHVSESMKRLLKERAKKESPLKPEIERKLLHFHTESINARPQFVAANLKETWGDPGIFYCYIAEEVKKYVDGDANYDPAAVCCGLRVQIEKIVYNQLSTSESKRIFLDSKNGTVDKLDYADEVGVRIPETYYLLGIVYNEALHWRDDDAFISRVAARLQNITILNMIKAVVCSA